MRKLSLLALAAIVFGVAVGQAQEFVPGEIIVKLKGKGKTLQSQAFIGKAVSEKGMTLKGSWSGMNMHHFALKPGEDLAKTLKQLKADPDVEFAEPNYIFRKQSTAPTGQPVSMATVRAASATNGTYSQTAAPIQEPEGWAAATSGLDEVVVAVIDTGIDYTHSVFVDSGAVWTNPNEIPGNGIDDDHNGFVDDVHGWNFVANNGNPMDDEGHGTHVSGIILGTSQDITAWNLQPAKIKIMPLKFLDDQGMGTTSGAIKAIYYAVNNGARVLNNSWGGGGYSDALLDAINYAYNHKVLFVAAAGNSGQNNDSSATYPANYNVPNVIAVAATTSMDALAGFSNYGKNTVHMGAPGTNIWSTYWSPYGPDSWQSLNGTSMATPFVSGVAAMAIRENPSMSGYEAKQIVFSGAQAATSLDGKTITGDRLNSVRTINNAKTAAIDGSQPSFSISAAREPASDSGEKAAGCGLVTKSIYDSDGPSGPQKNLMFFGVLLLLVSPVLVSVALRERDGKSRRRHTRYQLDSTVKVRVGERELVGSVSTISMGGVQLNADAWLENGGVVKMSISSPDGKEAIDVEGRVVWSEEKKRYGVAFENTGAGVKDAIANWTKGLLKA